MNKNQYRLVFSRVRGMLVAVEETAHATGKVSKGEAVYTAGSHAPSMLASFALRHAAFAALIMGGAAPMWANAQVVGAGANAPLVIKTQNGLDQVNINRPSSAGVSLNTFSQFDVPKAGTIVNNSPTLVNTQQAGYINGNPNFGPNTSAKIIINQVNSNNPSQLKGFVEIAGQRAEMIISNPSGIVADGAGFINTSRAILTTGTPNLNADGTLAGFNVTRGLITVQGAGLNATNVDQVDLISRAVQTNAAIYASNLNVIAGANQVNHDTLQATRIQDDGPAPAVAIDVAQLGGMFSNRILLVGTEGGVGVRNAGTIATDAMGLTLMTDGRLVQSGKISSVGNVSVTAAGGVENSGTTYGQQSVSLNTGADVVNTGTLAAQHNVGVTVGSLNSTGLLGAGVNSDGSVSQVGDLQVTTTGQLNATGKNVAGGNVSATGYGVNLAGSTTAANGNLALTATGADVNLTNATTSAQGTFTANAAGTVINDHGKLSSGGSTALTGGTVSNQSGSVSSHGPLTVTAAGQIANQAGVFVSDSTMALRGSTILNNQGTLQSVGRATVDGITIDNSAGRITSIGTDGLVLTATGQLTNAAGTTADGAQGGVIGGNGDVTVQGGAIANHATITSNTNLHVSGQSVNNDSGTLKATQNVAVDAGAHLSNSGGTIAGQTATLTGMTLDNSSGNVQADQVSLNATNVVNHAGTITQTGTGAMTVNVSNTLDNSSGGTLQTNSTDLTLAPATLVNDGGTITHVGAGTLTLGNGTGSVSNSGGTILSNGQINAQSGAFNNVKGTVSGKTGLAANVTGTLDNSSGKLVTGGNLSVDGGTLTNAGGAIGATANAAIHVDTLTNSGQIMAGQTATIGANSLVNDAGTIQAAQLALTAGNVSNHGGTLTQTGAGAMTVNVSNTLDNSGGTLQTNSTDLSLAPATLVNDGGTITHVGTGTLTLGQDSGTGSVSNAGGKIASNGQVVAQTGTLTNTAGSITAQTGLTATVSGVLNNVNGTLHANTDLGLTSGMLTNDGGQIGAGMNATIHSGSLTNQGGAIIAPNLSVTTDSTLNNNGGKLEGNQLALNAPNLTNQGGTITQYGSSAMGVNVSGTLDNSAGGVIQTNSTDLTLAPAQLNNSGGTITHGGTGTLTIEPGNGASALNNSAGTIVTKGQAVVDASSWDNSGGILSAQGSVTGTVAGDVNNAQGLVRAGASLSLTNGGTLVNQGGHIQAGQTTAGDTSTLAVQSGSINNADGAIADLGAGKMTVQGGSQITNSHAGNVQGMGAITGNGDVTISAATISNTQRGELSGASLHVQGNALDNSGGQIGNVTNSSGNVDVTTSGAVTNANGQISSTHDLTVTASTLQGGGTYSATHDADVNLQGDYTATSNTQFNVGNNLAFTLPGTFTNNATLQSVNGLSVDAGNIVNTGALSAGGLLHTQSGNLSNTGSLVGGSILLNATGTVSNVGPTALIGASDSNGTLEILAHDIENRDDTTATDSMPTTAIFGMGKVVLAGGKDAIGNYTNASLINNVSALIQSGGDMELHADKVTSTRRVMSTSGSTSNVDPAALAQYGISLSGCASYFAVNCAGGGQMIAGLRSDNITPAETAALIKQPGGMYIEPPHGGQWNSGYFYTTYTGTAVGNTVTALSPTAQIVSGGSVNATSTGTLQNYWSSITAVGTLNLPQNYDGNGWAATGQQAPTVTVTYSGQYHYNNYDSSEYNWQLPFGNASFVTNHPGGYTQVAPADIKQYKLPGYDSTLGSNGTISGTGVSINNTSANASIPSLGLLPGQSVPGLTPATVNGSASVSPTAGGMLNGTIAGSPVQSATFNGKSVAPVDRIIASATAQNVLNNLTIPQGGLFKPNPAPNASYVIETNPAFTNRNTFISSDYFFNQLGVDLTHIPKRLGDGFYEQQLVRNQVTSLTGKAVLGPYADLQTMYQKLMEAGASLEKSLNLPLGASLSSEQVSQLTSNVIMMETRVVDGQSVLVPVVYLAKANQQNFTGPLITATDIDLKDAQNFTNSGTLKADKTLTIQGQQIDNAFGALQSGGLMTLGATGNVDLTSSKVKAGSLLIGAGGDLILDTATTTTKQISRDGATSIRTTLGTTASIEVAGDAGIITGGNFQQNAGSLSVGGNFGALIGGDWNLGAVQTGEHKVVQRANGVSDTDINQLVVSSVKVGGQSAVAITGDLTSHGAQIELGKGGQIDAKGNVSLLTASSTSTLNSNSSGSDSHGRYTDMRHVSDQTLIGTTVKSGDALTLSSGKDITLSGSALSLDKGKATLDAKSDVNIGVATETHEYSSRDSGSHGSLVSSTKQASGLDQTDTISRGSLVSADSVSVTSGRDINVTGSAVAGTGDVSLEAARHVNILAAEDRSDSTAFYDKKQSGLMGSGGLGFTIGSAEQKGESATHSVTQSQDRSTVGSVQGNVSIKAGKNVHIGGSDVTAGQAEGDTKNATGNIKIVGQNVTIDPSQDDTATHDQQESKSSGMTFAITGTPLDTVRNLKDNASNGNGFQRGQSVATELGASVLDVPSISVTYGRSQSKSVTDTSNQTHAGSTIRGAGNVSVTATGGAQHDAQGNVTDGDISVLGSTISAGGKTLLDANRNLTLAASTDQYQQSTQSSSSSTSIALLSSPSLGDLGRWIGGTANHGGNSPSPYNASRASSDGNLHETRQTASLVTGDSVEIHSRTGDVNVVGTGVSGTNGVKITANQGAVNVLAGLETTTSHQESSSRQIGSLGSNGTSTGFSVGVASSHSVQDSASQSQNTMRSQIVSGNGNVTIEAKKDVTIAGTDVMAGDDVKLKGENVHLDPSSDTTQTSASQHSSQFGVGLALGGAVGNAVAAVNQSMRNPSRGGDARLGALDKAQAALSVYDAVKVAKDLGNGNPTAQPLVKATVSVGGGSSSSESRSNAQSNSGSTITAGRNVEVIATGDGTKDADGFATNGDIDGRGTQIIGKNVTLDAARDVNLQSAKDTTLQSSSNSSSGGSIGIGASLGGQQNGFTLELGGSVAHGIANGQSMTNRDTVVSASDTLTVKSGRDTNLRGAEATGDRVVANVGRDLNIASQQDTATYDSKQTSGGFQASVCVPPFCVGQTVSGSANIGQENIKSTYASVNQQSGIFAGNGGYDVNVGDHTQLDGGAIGSTASEDKNSLSTKTFGYTNIENTASYSGESVGFSASGGFGNSSSKGIHWNTPVTQAGPAGPGPVTSNGFGPSGVSAAGTGSDVTGTTYATVSPGKITVRGDAGNGRDSTAGLNRDMSTANGAVQNTFDAQKVQNDIAVQQSVGQVGMQVVGEIGKYLTDKATEAVTRAKADKAAAEQSGDPVALAKAEADLASAQQQYAMWNEDSASRTIAHAIVAGGAAALGGGNVAGAVGGTLAGDYAGKQAGQLTNDTLGSTLLGNLAAGAAGAAAGGAIGGASGALSGAGGALSADLYNRQLHQAEIDALRAKAKQLAASGGISYEDALERLSAQALRDVDLQFAQTHPGVDVQAQSWLDQVKAANPAGYNNMPFFQATSVEYKDPTLYANTKQNNPDVYQAANRPAIAGTLSPRNPSLSAIATGNAKAAVNSLIDLYNKGLSATGVDVPNAQLPHIQMSADEQAAASATATMALPFGFSIKGAGPTSTVAEDAVVGNNFYRDGSDLATWTPGKPADIAINAATHWQKHAAEFPEFQSLNDYLRGTSQFVKDPPAGTLSFTRSNGDVLLYDKSTNTFASMAADGTPRTMFRPTDGIEYWYKQTGGKK
ncbi:hemagglutinin repeat-containing protein [Burkholderia cenocepacia]|uniref:hemagglutinin repeat-containing protein n=1 Tax=Burkholderia cenocepacia TaxID=95486 RepID=UPI00406D0EDA